MLDIFIFSGVHIVSKAEVQLSRGLKLSSTHHYLEIVWYGVLQMQQIAHLQ